jgi:hypothetical protein
MKIALVYDPNVVAVSGTSSDAEDLWLGGDASTVLAAAHLALAADHDVALVGNDGDMEDRLLAFWPDIVINLTEAFASTEQESSLSALLTLALAVYRLFRRHPPPLLRHGHMPA